MTGTVMVEQSKQQSRVLETPGADPRMANSHFASRLAFETDASDVYTDLQSGVTGFVVVDARTRESFIRGHVPGAVSLPHREINDESTSSFDKEKVIVTYCSGVLCNASTKAAARLTALGFRVKEMIGGIDGWKSEGYPIETGTRPMRLQTPGRNRTDASSESLGIEVGSNSTP